MKIRCLTSSRAANIALLVLFAIACASCALHGRSPVSHATWPPFERATSLIHYRYLANAIALSSDNKGTVWLLSGFKREYLTRISPVSSTSGTTSIPIPDDLALRIAWNQKGIAWLWDPWSRHLAVIDSRGNAHIVTPNYPVDTVLDLAVARDGKAWFTRSLSVGRSATDQMGTLDLKGNVSFATLPVHAVPLLFDKSDRLWFVYNPNWRQSSIDPKISARVDLGGVGRMSTDRSVQYTPSERYAIGTRNGPESVMALSSDGSMWFLSFCGEIGRITPQGQLRVDRLPDTGCPRAIAADNRNGVWLLVHYFTGRLKEALAHIDDRGRIRLFRISGVGTMRSIAVDRNGDVWVLSWGELAKFIPPRTLRYRMVVPGK